MGFVNLTKVFRRARKRDSVFEGLNFNQHHYYRVLNHFISLVTDEREDSYLLIMKVMIEKLSW